MTGVYIFTLPEAKISDPFNHSLIKEREHSEKEGYSAMEEFFSLAKESPTALFIASGELTAGAYRFVREKGLKKNILVIGYFNKRDSVIPPGFYLPFSELGKASFNLLEESIKSRSEPREIKIPLELIWE
jgi:DNA-binding LacI/PurR family transcriptional regulator